MTVGKQHDGYWTSDRMCAQLPAAIAMFELSNGPHRQGVFIFDNSTGHNAYDDDALLAHKISLAPGGEKAALRVFEDDNGKTVHPTFQVGDTLLTDKKIFLPKTEAQKKMKGRKFGTGLDKRTMLHGKGLLRPGAFKAQLNKVQQIFKDAGHVCIFLPKYHPELNAIERYWGYVKHVLRLHCEYSLTHMLKILPRALSGVPLEHIRAWSRGVAIH
ncbi:unnamed protein product [Pylaiella littoralis]